MSDPAGTIRNGHRTSSVGTTPAVLSVTPGAGGGIRTPTVSPPTGPKPAAYAISPRPRSRPAGGRPLVKRYRLGADLGAQPGDVAGGLDGVQGLLDPPVRIHHERGPDHPDGDLAVELLLAPGAVGLEHGVVGVG